MNSTFEVLKDIGLFAVASGAITYLLHRSIDRRFLIKEKEIDHQNRLLEQQTQVVFSALHIKRAEAIHNLYDKLLDFKSSVLDVVNLAHVEDGKGQDRFSKFWELGTELHHMLERQGIYLDETTCELILKVTHHYDQAALNMQFGAGVPINFQEYVPKLQRSREIIKNDCLVALKELQNQFRKILGVK